MTGRSVVSVMWTARVLLLGTLASAVAFAAGLVLTFLGAADWAAVASTIGTLVLLATPALGLVTSAVELRRPQPRTAMLAVAVLFVMGVAAGVALLAH